MAEQCVVMCKMWSKCLHSFLNFWISNVHLQCSVSGFSYICSLMCTAVVYHDTVMARLSPKMLEMWLQEQKFPVIKMFDLKTYNEANDIQ